MKKNQNQNGNVWTNYVLPIAGPLVIAGSIIYAVHSNQYDKNQSAEPKSSSAVGLVNSAYGHSNIDESSIVAGSNINVGVIMGSDALENLPEAKNVLLDNKSLELVIANSIKVR